jgi:hypothetical protein
METFAHNRADARRWPGCAALALALAAAFVAAPVARGTRAATAAAPSGQAAPDDDALDSGGESGDGTGRVGEGGVSEGGGVRVPQVADDRAAAAQARGARRAFVSAAPEAVNRAAAADETPTPDVRRDAAIPAFEALLQQPLRLDPARRGQHPRLFFDADGLEQLRARARQHPEAWRAFLQHAAGVRKAPPAPPAQGRGQHYAAGLALPEPAFAFAVTRDPQQLAQARRWIEAVLAYEPWGYAYSKPDQDIPAAFLLYGLTFSYDLLAPDLTTAERDAVRGKIAEKAALLYDAYRWKPGRRYTFSQNHTFINAAAFGLAGLALAGEHPDAERWVALARAIFDRTARVYSPDGYYYEGYHYFEFSVPWIIHFLDALEQNTPERWYERLRLDLAKFYVAHALLPGGDTGGDIFDFGDAGTGAAGRAAHDRDILGSQALLYRIATRYHDPLSATVADWASRTLHLPDREPLWTFIWKDAGDTPPSVGEGSTTADRRGPGRSMDDIPLVYRFADADVVFARTGWTAGATAFAFKCGPPEGHAARALAAALPEWKQNSGHAHPDAGSFIIVSGGRYLTGDAGYTGVKMTADHNTLLIDGQGQAHDGRHEVFPDMPPAALDAIRIVRLDANRLAQAREPDATPGGSRASALRADASSVADLSSGPSAAGASTIGADGTSAYAPERGLRQWQRTFTFDGDRTFTIADHVALERPGIVSWLLHADRGLAAGRAPNTTGAAAAAPHEPPSSPARRGGAAQAARPGRTDRAEPAADGAEPLSFVIADGQPQLTVDVTSATPALIARIGPYDVIAQGRPGSVEKGARETRGQLLTLTTSPTTLADITVTLRVQPRKDAPSPAAPAPGRASHQ